MILNLMNTELMNQNNAEEEQAVLVHIKVLGEDTSLNDVQEKIFALEQKLEEIIHENNLGEFDGDEFGVSDCTLYMYGKNADSLFDLTVSTLRDFLQENRSTRLSVTKRYGEPGSTEETIDL
jgi:hypothetical protein